MFRKIDNYQTRRFRIDSHSIISSISRKREIHQQRYLIKIKFSLLQRREETFLSTGSRQAPRIFIYISSIYLRIKTRLHFLPRIRSFVFMYVCFREYTCMSVCIHIRCAFVCICVCVEPSYTLHALESHLSSNRVVVDGASFTLSRPIILLDYI